MFPSVTGYVTLLGLSAVVTGGLASYAWRRRAEPGALPFVGLMCAMTVWTVCYAIGLVTYAPQERLFWEQMQWFGISFVPVFWVLFATAYTGHDEFVSARGIGVLSLLPVTTLVLVWTNPWHGLVWAESRIVVEGGVATVVQQFGTWYWINLFYTYIFVGVGSFLLLRLVVISDYLYTDQSLLLAVGTLVPLVANAVSVIGSFPLPGLDLTPFAFTVTGLAFGYALFRRRLFELVPATRRLGRDTAIATLDDGILILDNDYRVIYLNPKASAILDCESPEALGVSAADLIDTTVIEFDVPDALAELHIEDRFYEVRTSTITDRKDRDIGHTLVLHDITARKHREHRLRRQRDELAQLDRLNEVIREITHTFVSTTSRDAIEDAVCTRLSTSSLYTDASIVVDSTDELVGDGGEEMMGAETPIAIPTTAVDGTSSPAALPEVLDTESGSWAVVPLGYGQSIYGALVLYTTRANAFDSRELAVLGQFGETISQALNAVENQRLLLADTVTELVFHCPDAALAEIAAKAACRLSLTGLVSARDGEIRVYCHTTDGSAQRIVDAASGTEGVASTRVIDDADGMVEFVLTGRSALLALSDGGANIRTAETTEEGYEVVVEVASGTDIRTLTEHIREYCPGATLAAKRDLDRPVETGHRDSLPGSTLDGLTDRQREVLEAAYRAGYFRWPRDRTAEEVAASIDISSPTLHKHLRRAEERLLDGLFEANSETNRLRKRK
ncbi:MAG TPA: histidine kinase N-terminal 7TM domain-containing protein [Halococcus sp.]|nr:histidine kinase N-terminal 7TM domain-containing protein [Halococcus sp.]